MSVLRAKNLVKKHKHRTIVQDINITVPSGKIMGLLGPNGAGKTTCFYLIVGLISADAGSVWLDEMNITRLSMPSRALLGINYLPQEASIFRKLTTEENILAILQLRRDLTVKQQKARADELLEYFHLTKIRDSMGISLSGGERRRVEIARALAQNPKFILLDEPFSGVDPISINEIKQLILQLKQQGIGFLITDHNVHATLEICDEATVVNQGRVLCSGHPQEILQNQDVKEIYLGEDFVL
jgi:lipopolysaccharide export system ATP-binding protein